MERNWLPSLINAWNMLVEIPIPVLDFRGQSDNEDDNFKMVVCFPVVGFLIGLAAYCLIWFIGRFQTPSATAAVSSILVVLGLEILSFGKNMTALVALFEAKIDVLRGMKPTLKMEENDTPFSSTFGLTFLVSVVLMRIFCVALLVYYQRSSWLIVTLTTAYAVQASLAAGGRKLNNSAPLVKADEKAIRLSWITALVLSFICGYNFPAVLITYLIIFFFTGLFRNYCENNFGGLSGRLVGMAGLAAETIILLTGIIFLIRD